MNKLRVEMHAQDVSDVFWRNLALRHAPAIRWELNRMDQYALLAEQRRMFAAYNTGSVPSATALALLLLGREMQPDVAFEVGTFIGNTTRALAATCKHVHTCDASNDIKLDLPNVTQYRLKTSTDALKEFSALDQKINLLFLDGRLQPGDGDLLATLVTQDTVVALDDCYQLEKGMVNVSMLKGFYVPPPRGEPFAAFGVPGGTTLGLVVPGSELRILQA